MQLRGKAISEHQLHEQVRIIPHPRTIRKAREQIRGMVEDGLSAQRIKRYLHRFILWWANTSATWHYHELLKWFLDVCWDANIAAYAASLMHQYVRKSHAATLSTQSGLGALIAA